jgi:hypothetical protein
METASSDFEQEARVAKRDEERERIRYSGWDLTWNYRKQSWRFTEKTKYIQLLFSLSVLRHWTLLLHKSVFDSWPDRKFHMQKNLHCSIWYSILQSLESSTISKKDWTNEIFLYRNTSAISWKQCCFGIFFHANQIKPSSVWELWGNLSLTEAS